MPVNKLIDKLMLLILCGLGVLFTGVSAEVIGALLIAVTVSALNSYSEQKTVIPLCMCYCAAVFFWLGLALFLPMMAYDLAGQKRRLCLIAPAAVVLFTLAAGEITVFLLAFLFSIFAWILRSRTDGYEAVQEKFYLVQDNSKEKEAHLERKNRELMEKQDYEVRLATLTERNRIAREIHDNVGHLLTRSLLQVGAMQVVNQQDEGLNSQLSMVKDTLSDAMDNIRSSVHDLHDDSLELKIQLYSLIETFDFCPVAFTYEAESVPKQVQYCFAAVVKEALSNIARHSNATQASVMVLEHPALYQLMVEDNGTKRGKEDPNGIGLQNMRDRVEALCGIFRTEQKKGFRVFISVPKRQEEKPGK